MLNIWEAARSDLHNIVAIGMHDERRPVGMQENRSTGLIEVPEYSYLAGARYNAAILTLRFPGTDLDISDAKPAGVIREYAPVIGIDLGSGQEGTFLKDRMTVSLAIIQLTEYSGWILHLPVPEGNSSPARVLRLLLDYHPPVPVSVSAAEWRIFSSAMYVPTPVEQNGVDAVSRVIIGVGGKLRSAAV